MGQAMGMLDFFVLEAGEYLERLDALAQAPAGPFPSGDEFVRIVRAWRGGALMASQQAMARAAQGLEAAGRALKEGRLAWDERSRGEVIRAVDDCKALLHRIRTPESEDAARAEAIGAALERLAGRTSGSARAPGEGLDAGGRAFVAREAAAIASALDRAAQGLGADLASREALAGVTPAMSALRGVAVLNDLPPLADLLNAVDGALKEVFATAGAVAPGVPAVFDAAAKALARAAREVVDVGRPATESAQAEAFASALLSSFAGTGPILPIEMLFYDDAGPHVVRQGAAPTPLSRVELVSLGEFLERTADELARAPSPVVRDLRLFAIASKVRPLTGAGGAPVATALGRLADAGRGAIDRGAASADVGAFAAAVADGAHALRDVVTGEEAPVVARLEAAAGRLDALAAPAAAPPPPAARARSTRVVQALAEPPGSAAAPQERPRISAAAPAPPAVPPGAGDERDLAWGYSAMERLISDRGVPMGSLEELVSGPTAAEGEEAGVVPIESLAPDEDAQAPVAAVAPVQEAEEGVVPIEALAPAPADEDVIAIESLAPAEDVIEIASLAPDDDVVPIEHLLYDGQAALRRALELRAELAALVTAPGQSAARLSELQREVFDLVELGLRA